MKNSDDNTYGWITHLQPMSLHDGPGIRTTVFMKGCNLSCKWCHNPETFKIKPQMEWIASKCIGCGTCIDTCKENALEVIERKIIRDTRKCIVCGKCAKACYTGAHTLIGTRYTPEEIYSSVEKDIPFFRESGGGVTLSGGEPMIQPAFTTALARLLSSKGIHVVLQTNLSLSWHLYEKIFPYIDHVMADLKHIDREKHLYWTGADNNLILENIQRLDKSGISYRLRTPVIPGVNDDEETIIKMSRFAGKMHHAEDYELLPFHPMASYKYDNLGMKYIFASTPRLSDKKLKYLNSIANQYKN